MKWDARALVFVGYANLGLGLLGVLGGCITMYQARSHAGAGPGAESARAISEAGDRRRAALARRIKQAILQTNDEREKADLQDLLARLDTGEESSWSRIAARARSRFTAAACVQLATSILLAVSGLLLVKGARRAVTASVTAAASVGAAFIGCYLITGSWAASQWTILALEGFRIAGLHAHWSRQVVGIGSIVWTALFPFLCGGVIWWLRFRRAEPARLSASK